MEYPKYKLPRKKKKALKKLDPELYRITFLLHGAGVKAFKAGRYLSDIVISIDSIGGTIRNAFEIRRLLNSN